jgi:hypothetical protein
MVLVFTTVIMFFVILFWYAEKFNRMARERNHQRQSTNFIR